MGPRVATWGTFDVANFGDHLFPRIFERELTRRLPGVVVQPFSPLGHLHPVSLDGGLVVEPLGEWRPERLAELARRFDLVAIGGGEIIHPFDDLYAVFCDTSVAEARRLRPSAFFGGGLGPELHAKHPVVWNAVGIPFELESPFAEFVRDATQQMAYLSVREEVSRERLERIGVTRDIRVVPDSGFLLRRLFTDEQLGRRLRQLRELGCYPASEPPLVVQGSQMLLEHVNAVTSSLAEAGDVPILLLETGTCHGDAEFADALAERLDGRVLRMPESPTVEDIVAAIVHARGFAGISLHGNIVALASGIPNAIFDLGVGYSKLAGMAALVGCESSLVRTPEDVAPAIRRVLAGEVSWHRQTDIETALDRHFDELAELATRSSSSHLGDGTSSERRLRRAFDARGQRLVQQRLRLTDEVRRVESDLAVSERRVAAHEARAVTSEQEVARLRSEVGLLRREVELANGELESLRSTRTFRYTAKLRDLYAGARRRRS
jgi:polysaccharide pyruvyl transferase WcaK-like protein